MTEKDSFPLQAEIMERTMYQYWCYMCRSWVGTPRNTQYDVPGHVISQHLGSHISSGSWGCD